MHHCSSVRGHSLTMFGKSPYLQLQRTGETNFAMQMDVSCLGFGPNIQRSCLWIPPRFDPYRISILLDLLNSNLLLPISSFTMVDFFQYWWLIAEVDCTLHLPSTTNAVYLHNCPVAQLRFRQIDNLSSALVGQHHGLVATASI